MSAYQVQDAIIHTVVGLLHLGQYTSEEQDATLGRQLVDMNARAVSHRYEGNLVKVPYVHRTFWIDEHKIDIGDLAYLCQLFKTIQCYIYQCTEGDVPKSALYKRCQDVMHDLQDKIVASLVEYQQATWGAPPWHRIR